MTREEAARVLTEKAEVWEGVLNHMVSAGDFSELKQIEDYETALRMGAAALRGPEPDPDTGLVPCGCGGKAQIINSSGYSRRLYVECDRCDIMLGVEATGDGALQGIYRYDDQIIKDWNRAMGYWEEEGHD